MRLPFIVLFAFWVMVPAFSQTDNILWSGFKLQKSIDQKWGIAFQPYFRFDQDFGSYQNTSIDYSLRYNLNSEWYAQVLGRTWFIPENPQRQFVWFDIGYKKRYSSIPVQWTNRLRWHIGLNIHERQDGDFFRYLTQLQWRNAGRFHPIIGFELWLQSEPFTDFTRYRIEPGFRYDTGERSNLLLLWRREDFINIPSPFGNNLWVLVMTFDL